MDVVQVPARAYRTLRRTANGISYRREASFRRPISQMCTFEQVTSPEYAAWCARLQLPALTHRKLWEWCYILQVLDRGGMLAPGKSGLGFGVGHEPIAAVAASRGCVIVATDSPASTEGADGWHESGQHAQALADLNDAKLCPEADFSERVSFEAADMRAIPDQLRGFDFCWSSCAFEHLGSIDAGLEFFERQIACLAPGGIGVHTTEYNVFPDTPTLEAGPTVIYHRHHLEALAKRVRRQGHRMRITFAPGHRPEDGHVDRPPFTDIHIRTETGGVIHTSFGLVVRRGR